MPDLEPITREEKLLDGEDLTPITRKEKFIKRIYDKTQEIPEPITREEYFLKKAGEGGGGDVTIEQLDVSENGTYSESGKAYSPVVVNVPQPTLTTLDVTENGTYTAPSGTAYNEVDVNVPLPENAYLLEEYEDVPTDIASFTASDAPLKSLTASIVPVQDLHGYDGPWVGGAGKNKLPLVLADIKTLNTSGTWSGDAYTISGVTFTILTDSNGNVTGVSANGTTTGNITFLLTDTNGSWMTDGTTYKINGSVGGSYNTWSIWVQGHGTHQSEMSLDGDGTFTYTDGGSTSARISVDSGVSLSNQMFRPMLRLATETDATFAPYSNICPISGHTGVDAWVRGKNLLPMTVESIKAANTTGTWSGNAYTLNDVTFTILTDNDGKITGIKANGASSTNRADLYLFKAQKIDLYNGKILSGIPSNIGGTQFYMSIAMDDTPWTSYIDRGSGAIIGNYESDILGSLYITTRKDYALSDVIVYPMIRLADQSAEYEPYAGTTTTIPFTDGQGQSVEVFGGSVDVIDGEVTPCPYYASYNGEQLTGEWISDRDVYSPNTSPTIGAQVVNIGATGTTISVHPTSIKSLDGENNVSASTGQIESLEFFTKEA